MLKNSLPINLSPLPHFNVALLPTLYPKYWDTKLNGGGGDARIDVCVVGLRGIEFWKWVLRWSVSTILHRYWFPRKKCLRLRKRKWSKSKIHPERCCLTSYECTCKNSGTLEQREKWPKTSLRTFLPGALLIYYCLIELNWMGVKGDKIVWI